MNSRKIIVITTIVFISMLMILLIFLEKQVPEKEYISKNEIKNVQAINSEKKNDDINENTLGKEIVKISAIYDRVGYTMETINQDNYFVALGKIKSIDGSTNYNSVKNVYTTIMSYGTLEVTETIKGNLEKGMIPIMVSGGTLPWLEYEKGLLYAQKQKKGIQELTQEEKENRIVESIGLDEIQPKIDKEYLCIMCYSEDYNKYKVDNSDDVFREVKREDGKIYLKNNTTGEWKLFTKIEDAIVR